MTWKPFELLKLSQGRRRDSASGSLQWGILADNPVVPGRPGESYVRFPAGQDDNGVQQYYPPVAIPEGIGAAFLKKGGRRVWVGLDPLGQPEIVRGDRLDLREIGITASVTNPLTREGKPANPANPFTPLLSEPVGTAATPSMKVTIYPFWYDDGVALYYYPGTPAEADKIDLTSSVPSAGLWRYAALWLTIGTTTITVTTSTPATITSTSPGNATVITALQECDNTRPANSISIKAFYLADAQTALTQHFRHIDLRQMVNIPAAVSTLLPVVDTTAIVKGSADATKLLRFEVDGFTTGTTRIMTLPNYDGTLATLSGTEVLTDKTLTSPVINTGVSGTAIDDDATFASPSSTKVPTTNAVKSYVDAVAQGLSIKYSVLAATAAALPTNVYNNGASGVGATLTAVATGVLTVDGQTIALNDRVLVKDEVTAANNGIYKCTIAGAVGVAFVLTRVIDMDTAAEIPGAFTFVENGTVNDGAGFVVADPGPFTIGTTAISWTQFSGTGEITVTAPIVKTGSNLSHADTAVTPGAYTHASVTVDQKGHVTNASNGTIPLVCQTRLEVGASVAPYTLNSGTVTVISLVPWKGQIITLYDGTLWRNYDSGVGGASAVQYNLQPAQTGTTTNLSTSVTGLSDTTQLAVGMTVTGTGIAGGTTIAAIVSATAITLSAAATASGSVSLLFKMPGDKNFDLFAFQSSGTVKLGAVVWTNDTTRATALDTTTGPTLFKSGDATWRYLGTGRTLPAAGQIEKDDRYCFLWNFYNPVPHKLWVIDPTNSYTYTTASYRQTDAASTNQFAVVVGLDAYTLIQLRALHNAATTSGACYTGIGEDSTTVIMSEQVGGLVASGVSAGFIMPGLATAAKLVPLGYHYYAWLERGNTGVTFYGDNGGTLLQSGMEGALLS